MTSRPTGITLLGILFLALGALSFLWSLLVFGVGGATSLFSTIFTFSPTISGGFWSGLLGMAAAAVQFAAGVGLLRMSSWAWYLAIIGVGLSVIQGVIGMFSGGILSFFCGCFGILIPAGILIYLMQPKIRALFGIGMPK